MPPVLLEPVANCPRGHGHRRNICAIVEPVANLPPVSTTLVKLVAKFAAGVNNTSTMTLMLFSGAWEKMIHD